MKIKLESSSYNFKMKEEEDSFKARIKDSLDIDVEKFEFNADLRSIANYVLTVYGANLVNETTCRKLNT